MSQTMPAKPRAIDPSLCPHGEGEAARPHYSGGRCRSCYYKHRVATGQYNRKTVDEAYEQSEAAKERTRRYRQTPEAKAKIKAAKEAREKRRRAASAPTPA